MTGLGAGVIVVDADLRVLVWTSTSQELWGLRADEVIGQPLESLDIGLDPAHLADHARRLLPAARPAPDRPAHDRPVPEPGNRPARGAAGGSEWLQAVNRRGRAITVRVTAQRVVLHGGLSQVILTVEEQRVGRDREGADGKA
jgi:two-component system CheB/CheR fusion protein